MQPWEERECWGKNKAWEARTWCFQSRGFCRESGRVGNKNFGTGEPVSLIFRNMCFDIWSNPWNNQIGNSRVLENLESYSSFHPFNNQASISLSLLQVPAMLWLTTISHLHEKLMSSVKSYFFSPAKAKNFDSSTNSSSFIMVHILILLSFLKY